MHVEADVEFGGESVSPEVHDSVAINSAVRREAVTGEEATGRGWVQLAISVGDFD